MGYTTDFEGKIEIVPPLNSDEIQYLKKFNRTRRMKRTQGAYYVDAGGHAGQLHGDDVLEYNRPPDRQPGLWCGWTVSDDGTHIEWDGREKFYYADDWMEYIIEHFIGDDPLAKKELPFLKSHKCNGVISAQGEVSPDKWELIVKNNKVTKIELD